MHWRCILHEFVALLRKSIHHVSVVATKASDKIRCAMSGWFLIVARQHRRLKQTVFVIRCKYYFYQSNKVFSGLRNCLSFVLAN